jgi:hypothetical protein
MTAGINKASLSGQAGFLYSGTIGCFWSTWLLPLRLLQKQGIRNTSSQIREIKTQIQECIQGITKETLQRVVTSYHCDRSSVLQDMVMTCEYSYSNSND